MNAPAQSRLRRYTGQVLLGVAPSMPLALLAWWEPRMWWPYLACHCALTAGLVWLSLRILREADA